LTAVVKKRRGLPKKGAFLAAYIRTASVTRAARAAKVERRIHYTWLEEDPEYVKAFSAAKVEAAQLLEDEAIRRAHEGVDEPLTYKGQFTYKTRPKKDRNGNPIKIDGKQVLEEYGRPLAVTKYSDALLMFLLKGFLPGKYRDNASVEVSGPGGASIPMSDPRLAELSDEELETLVNLTLKLEPAQ